MAKRHFSGEVAGYYARFRRGFPPAVTDSLVAALGLAPDDIVVDLGCGTGQLTLPLAERVRAVVGVDPEPDMLALARDAATARAVTNVSWQLGDDRDLPALGGLLGDRALGAVTIATAIHLMAHEELFAAAARVLRAGGAITVIANGKPLWLLDTDWSRALRGCLERWSGRKASYHCGTDAESRARYREALTAAGFAVSESVVDYAAELAIEDLIGNLYSAMGGQLPAPDQQPAFERLIRDALHPAVRFTEPVRVAALIGRAG
jgi:ubiquinone/menaquinone biosynthesis C-methylase UbiE